MTQLPPLNALRAFESAARHLSFSRAADELNVTPGAISQQIKLLEQVLNTQLFVRHNRMIELTQQGQLLLPSLTTAFQHMTQGIQNLQSHQQDQPLTISAPPSFVAKWLIPRLAEFNKQYPDIEVRIDSSVRLVDFEKEQIDVGIRFSMGPDPTLDSTHLMSLDVIPVCSPDFLKQQEKLENPADIACKMLLHYDSEPSEANWPDWNMWLTTMGYEDIDSSQGTYYSQPDMLIQAAIEGQGIGLMASVFAEKDIQAKRLEQPFKMTMPIRFSYYLVTTFSKAELTRVKAFKQWVLNKD